MRFDRYEFKPALWIAVALFIALVIGIALAVTAQDSTMIGGNVETSSAAASTVEERAAPIASVSSHVLDISRGAPAAGVRLTFYRWSASVGQWSLLKQTLTNSNGRVATVHPNLALAVGTYKLHFDTGTYFTERNQSTFYPFVEVIFNVDDASQHYHVPLTLSAFGYSTYRGS